MLTNLDNIVRYAVSGSSYAITYPYWSVEEIKAYITLPDGTVSGLTYGTDFTVTAPNGVNGTLTKVSAWTDAEKLTIVREVELTQEIDLINGEKIDGEQLETGLDLKTAGLQQLNEKFTRSVMTSIDETGDNMVIPNSTARKGTGDGTLLGFDGTGGSIVLRDLKQFDADVTNTATNASAASASATLAQKWAENPEDTPVVTGSYSALHHANKAKASATSASTDATTATNKALDSEAYAIGKRNGVDVPNTDPAYHNNSKYYKEQAGLSAGAASGSATSAYNSELAAAASEDKAHDWADKATDSEVEPGEYSAKHWASKASQSSGSAAISAYNAGLSETAADTSAKDSEAWAVGKRGGTDVDPSDPAYHNNAKWYNDNIAQQTVTPDNTATLTNKTISYADNTLSGVQPTLTAGTGIDITGTTISCKTEYGNEIDTGATFNNRTVYSRLITIAETDFTKTTSSSRVTQKYELSLGEGIRMLKCNGYFRVIDNQNSHTREFAVGYTKLGTTLEVTIGNSVEFDETDKKLIFLFEYSTVLETRFSMLGASNFIIEYIKV